ncbi:probable pre-mRNA-splicing factor ATP-dependent RNA helicase DEAH4 [Contarinia nasturtii]|uniref:probable pre-mRNA-splicing factor ATP-dependent RNA helicase DEAH4 n=1 Tax=Contarinia nasturtii TaxID=265458 RepID=UPI0012D37938|nr:probable pre-mRNA-splicing factor ATP-dependent RNA helicase DEAH4 [Contarinia nasturtii]
MDRIEVTNIQCPSGLKIDSGFAIVPVLFWNKELVIRFENKECRVYGLSDILPGKNNTIMLSKSDSDHLNLCWEDEILTIESVIYIDSSSLSSNNDDVDMLDDTVEDKKNEKFPAYYKYVTNIDLVGKIVNNIENDTLPVDNFEDIDNFTISLPQYITGQKYPPPRPKHQIFPDNFTQEKLSEISKMLRNLPAYFSIDNILHSIDKNKITILIGGTGCGKTILVPHALLEKMNQQRKAGLILIGEPKRISAQKAAQTLSNNYAGGFVIGSHIHKENATTDRTNLVFLTSGVLILILKSLVASQKRVPISHIVIDEAHEGNIDSDSCILILTNILRHYPEIKLVVMSATLNTEKFHSYFIKYGYTPNIINIPGQAQKLTIQYASPSSSHQNDNDEDSSTNEQEDILIFLPGMDEINMCEEHIKAHKLSKNYSLEIRRLHQTSITLPNLKFVIDSGYEKSIKYIPKIDAFNVQLNMISQSSANQRAGRAGRVSDGLVYRAYTEERYNAMCEHKIPENQSLLSYCLKVMDFTKKPVNFISNLINPPNANEIYMALKQLHLLRAVNYTESDQEPTLTRLGRKIIDINAEVPVVISLIYGIAFKCIDPVMYTLSAQNDSCIYQETGRSKESRKIETSKQIAGFLNNKNGKGESDHFIDLTIFQHCLKYNIAKVHEQMQINSDLLNKNRSFYDDLKKFLKFHFSNVIDKDINKNANNPDLIRFCIAAGLRHKIAYRDENDGKWFDYKTNQKLNINLKSSVQENTGNFYCYERKNVRQNASESYFYAQNITKLSPAIISLLNIPIIDMDEELKVYFNRITVKIENIIEKTIRNLRFDVSDNNFITSVVEFLAHSPTLIEIPTSKIYEVTIAIHDIWHMGEKPLNAEFKDIIREIFSEFEIIHTYVQTLEPHQGYIVVPSTTNFNKIFELDTLPGKNENKLTLGFGYCRNVNFINSQNPKFWNEQLFARHYPEISLPTK